MTRLSAVSGVVVPADTMNGDELVTYARELERLGYRELWLPDVFGREIYVTAAHLLAHTETLRVATGIAHIYGRDALSTAQAARTLSELSEGRFLLGLGVSNPIAAEIHGVAWDKPVSAMRAYLETFAAAVVRVRKTAAAPVFVAAHGPKMLALAAELADGANTYLMPPEHTRRARDILGSEKRLNVVLPCCLDRDAKSARAAARQALSIYLPLAVYRERWREHGLGEDDLGGGGSDRLVDMLVAWGDEAAIRGRIGEHIDAGASTIEVIDLSSRSAAAPSQLLSALAAD